MAGSIVDRDAYQPAGAHYSSPWTTLMDNLMDGYVSVHEVSHRELTTGFPDETTKNA
jgi:hypothetical protein